MKKNTEKASMKKNTEKASNTTKSPKQAKPFKRVKRAKFTPTPVTREDIERSMAGGFTGALRANNITPVTLALKLREELEAETEKIFYDRGEKEIIKSTLVDWKTRQEARRDACKLLNLFPKEEGSGVTINMFTQIVEATDPLRRRDG